MLQAISTEQFKEIVTIVSAVIAAVAAIVGLIISKDQETTRYRKQWIDELTKHLSDFIGLASFIINHLHISRESDEIKERFILKYTKALDSLNAHILLRLDLDNHQELRRALAELWDKFNSRNDGHAELAIDMIEPLTTKARVVIAEEWERIYQGEPATRLIKGIIWVLIVAAASALFFLSII